MEKHNSPRQLQQDPENEQAFGEHPMQPKMAGASMPPPPFQLKSSGLDPAPENESSMKENNTGLPDDLKSGIEGMSGMSMDDVNVHYNSDKPSQLQAHAYAQGTDIHVAPGQEKHLPHEAWHVVQQKQGRVNPTVQLKGKVAVNDDEGLEREADVMGDKAMQFKADAGKAATTQLKAVSAEGEGVAQMVRTRARSVAMDMVHPEFDNLFDDYSEFNYLWEGTRAGWSRERRVTSIERHIASGEKSFRYAKLSNDTLSNASDLIGFAPHPGENMYVHYGSTIHTAQRVDEKKPHPTLVGDDPDVTCAGTLNIAKTEADGNTTYTVDVTNDSGHFRPDGVPDKTVNKINELAQKSVPANTTINVNKRER